MTLKKYLGLESRTRKTALACLLVGTLAYGIDAYVVKNKTLKNCASRFIMLSIGLSVGYNNGKIDANEEYRNDKITY